MGAYPKPLSQFDYIEEEYFISGEAACFGPLEPTGGPDGKWSVDQLRIAPFKTRLLVHRPVNPARFNGTVLVEWNNVSAGRDLTLVPDDAIYNGFIYIGVSVQYVSVHGFDSESLADREGLRQWDPERYYSLFHPGDSFSYDIFTQVGRLLKSAPGQGIAPLAEFEVRNLIAVGGSQSAMRVRTYINALHQQELVYDGYVLFLDFGNCSDFSDAIFEPHIRTPAYRERVFRYPTCIRDDLLAPVILVNSEKEAVRYRDLDRRFLLQPDTDLFVCWEVAGAAHVPDIARVRMPYALAAKRDGLIGPRKRWPSEAASSRPGSRVSVWPCTIAAINHVRSWIEFRIPLPRHPRLLFSSGSEPRLQRDARGIALGGVRLPEAEVPISVNTGLNNEPGLAENRGLSVPFSSEQLRLLYPTHQVYVEKVTEAARSAEFAGAILPYRVGEYIQEANSAAVPE